MSVFEVIASNDEQAVEADNRSVIAAQTRAQERFAKFIGKAVNDDDRAARLALIDPNLRDLAREAAEEYGGDPDRAFLAATAVLGGGHAADCDCGFCQNKGKGFGSDSDSEEETDDEDKKESSVKFACASCDCEDCDESCDGSCCAQCKQSKESKVSMYHVAVETETGDSYQSETLDLGSTTGDNGVQDVGSPKIDKGNSGDVAGWNLDPIDVGSKRHELESQDATDKADYNKSDFDPSSPVRDRVEADSPMQPEHNVADGTKTWTGTEGLADPVTSAVTSKLRNWTVVED